MKSGVSMMGLQFCGWPAGVLTSNIPFTPPLPNLGSGLGLSEGNGNSFLTSNVASSKSESPVPQNEKSSSAQPPAVEVARPVDFPSPKPIPEGRYIKMAYSHLFSLIIMDSYIATESLMCCYFLFKIFVKDPHIYLDLEMQFGWWRIIDPEDLKTLLKVLHLRGIREKALQKQIQKHLDYITQACIKNKDGMYLRNFCSLA
jgi:hypothetical protein